MSRTEQRRGWMVTKVLAGELTVAEAAPLLALSERQVWRLVAAMRHSGPAGLVHGNRGRASPRRLPDPDRERIVALARGRYAGVNDCHAASRWNPPTPHPPGGRHRRPRGSPSSSSTPPFTCSTTSGRWTTRIFPRSELECVADQLAVTADEGARNRRPVASARPGHIRLPRSQGESVCRDSGGSRYLRHLPHDVDARAA